MLNNAPGIQQSHTAVEGMPGTAWVVLVDGNLEVFQQGALAAVEANLVTGCINKRTES